MFYSGLYSVNFEQIPFIDLTSLLVVLNFIFTVGNKILINSRGTRLTSMNFILVSLIMTLNHKILLLILIMIAVNFAH